MVSNAESATERILKTIGTSYFCNSFAKISFFPKSSNDFELKSFLQSTLETYEFQQRKILPFPEIAFKFTLSKTCK